MSAPPIIRAEVQPWTGGGWATNFFARHDGANIVFPALPHDVLLTGQVFFVAPYGPNEPLRDRTYPERVRFRGGLELSAGVQHAVQVVGRVVPQFTNILIPAEFLLPGSLMGRYSFIIQGYKPAHFAEHFAHSAQEREGDAVARVADFPIDGAGIGRPDSSRVYFSQPGQHRQHQVVVPANAGGGGAGEPISDVGGARDLWVFAFDEAGNGLLAFPEFEQLFVRDLERERHDSSSGMEGLCRPPVDGNWPEALEASTADPLHATALT